MTPVTTCIPAAEDTAMRNLSKDLLLQLVVDEDFRKEYRDSLQDAKLPMQVEPQDMTFSELVRDAVDVSACANTCLTGFTILCDGTTIDCRNTCISGLTWKCDGTTL
jgi:hypothetical protein